MTEHREPIYSQPDIKDGDITFYRQEGHYRADTGNPPYCNKEQLTEFLFAAIGRKIAKLVTETGKKQGKIFFTLSELDGSRLRLDMEI